MQDATVARKIRDGKLLGVRSGVNGTPTLFINGVRYEGKNSPVEEEELKLAIEAALRAAEQEG